jgi:hypothetical protein
VQLSIQTLCTTNAKIKKKTTLAIQKSTAQINNSHYAYRKIMPAIISIMALNTVSFNQVKKKCSKFDVVIWYT